MQNRPGLQRGNHGTNWPIVLPERSREIESSESEDPDDYRPGGYLKVRPGDQFENGRYTALQKLGWGHFSTVWLCFDAQERKHVAIKVQKSAFHYGEAALDEIKLLQDLKKFDSDGNEPVVHLLHYFIYENVDTRESHVCMVFDVLGKSLLSLIRRCNYDGCPIPLVKIITRQILQGLNYVHTQCRIIHTDIKPENVLFVLTEEESMRLSAVAKEQAERLRRNGMQNGSRSDDSLSNNLENLTVNEDGEFDFRAYLGDPDLTFRQGKVKVVDFGNGCWVDRQFTDDIQTRQYRSPEVILCSPYDTSADIWSLACLVFELLTGDFLFDPREGTDYDRDEDHLAVMMELLGPMSRNFCMSGRRSSKYFTDMFELQHIRRLNYWTLRDVLREKYILSPEDSERISSFMLPMLAFDPARRSTARQCLDHPWLAIDEPRTDIRITVARPHTEAGVARRQLRERGERGERDVEEEE